MTPAAVAYANALQPGASMTGATGSSAAAVTLSATHRRSGAAPPSGTGRAACNAAACTARSGGWPQRERCGGESCGSGIASPASRRGRYCCSGPTERRIATTAASRSTSPDKHIRRSTVTGSTCGAEHSTRVCSACRRCMERYGRSRWPAFSRPEWRGAGASPRGLTWQVVQVQVTAQAHTRTSCS